MQNQKLRRLDNRTKSEFKKWIKTTTETERILFNLWKDAASGIVVKSYKDNGVDNTGEYVEGISTMGADYFIELAINGNTYKCPLEIKWVPRRDKITLKINDLKAYKNEKAHILFIYPAYDEINMKHIQHMKTHEKERYIASNIYNLKWGLMDNHTIENILSDVFSGEMKVFKPAYMGHKPCVLIKWPHYEEYFYYIGRFNER